MFRRRLLVGYALCIGIGVGVDGGQDNANDAQKFYAAIRSGDVRALGALIDQGISPNVVDERGVTPLMNATAVGSVQAMTLLLDRGADVNGRNAAGSTALMWAVHEATRVRLLLDRGADVNPVTANGRTALMIASTAHPSGEIVKILLDRHVSVEPREGPTGFNAAIGAVANRDAAAQAALIDSLGDVNTLGTGFRRGYTALMIAAATGNVDAVTRLLRKGADVNARTPDLDPTNTVKAGQIEEGGYTALLLASTYGPPELVKALLDAKADVNARDVRGMTPLMLSLTTDRLNPAIARLLLAHGADRTMTSKAGETALDWARKYGRADVLALLDGRPSPPRLVPVARVSTDATMAVARSVKLLERTGNEFFAGGGCFGCHAQAAALIAHAAARGRGIAIDEGLARELLTQTTRQVMPRPALIMERQVWKPTGAADQMLYAFEALARGGYPPERATDFAATEIAADQWDDGGWHGNSGVARTPLADGDFSRTTMAIRLLKTYTSPARRDEAMVRIERAKQWLLRGEPVITEDFAMRLSGAALAGAGAAEIRMLAAPLVRRQRDDGGWAQRDGLASDAYATGLVLTALAESGALQTNAAVYRKGVTFLLGTQAADGSWHVRSRAAKIQPYFESGFPYGHDQWISSMGTAWATTALALALAPSAPAEKARSVSR